MFIIDVLASGGAQRQLCELSALLVEYGLKVHVQTYHPADFYLEFLASRGVSWTASVRPISRHRRLMMVWNGIRKRRPRVVCAFLTGACLMAELARLCAIHDFRLVVSERSSDARRSLGVLARMVMHTLADAVVVNSSAQERFIRDQAAWLVPKLACIRNCVDVDRFVPQPPSRTWEPLRLVVVGSYTPHKNPGGLLRGLRQFLDMYGEHAATLVWYGNMDNLREVYEATDRLRLELGLDSCVQLRSQVSDIERVYAESDALCLAAFVEGTPNVVCEAMAAGLPVLASRVGDLPCIIEDGHHGFLFDPGDVATIAGAIARLHTLSYEKRVEMSRRNRGRAEFLFGKDRFLTEWLHALGFVRG